MSSSVTVSTVGKTDTPGAVGVSVLPVPLADHATAPSAFLARTRTRYSLPVSRFPMVALGPVSFWGPSVQPVSVVFWYCRS